MSRGPAPRTDVASAPALNNMSAPPRSTVEIRPLRAAAHGARRSSPTAHGASARLFARVCLVGLLSDGDASRPRGRDIARCMDGREPVDLIDAVAALRLDRFGPWCGDSPLQREQARCRALPVSRLHDELLDRLGALGDRGLPPLLLARPLDPSIELPADASRLSPQASLRLLAGTAGGLFVRARSPGTGPFLTGMPGVYEPACGFDYWLPTGASR